MYQSKTVYRAEFSIMKIAFICASSFICGIICAILLVLTYEKTMKGVLMYEQIMLHNRIKVILFSSLIILFFVSGLALFSYIYRESGTILEIHEEGISIVSRDKLLRKVTVDLPFKIVKNIHITCSIIDAISGGKTLILNTSSGSHKIQGVQNANAFVDCFYTSKKTIDRLS